MRLRYVNADHAHPLWRQVGDLLVRSGPGGPRNQLVRLDSGLLVVAPYGNWRRVQEEA